PEDVSPNTRTIVLAHLQDVCGTSQLGYGQSLARDLGLDSLKRSELLLWLESEFGVPQGNTDSVQTVGDVLLAAAGQLVSRTESRAPPPPPTGLAAQREGRLQVAPGESVAAAFLASANQAPNRAIVADVKSGPKTSRELITGILALLPAVKA